MALFDDIALHLNSGDSFTPNVQMRNPREAAKAFAQIPRQRNVFMVRFQPNGSVGANTELFSRLSFMVKTVDRPRIVPKAEELHQYNKKRQIYTGFKIEPVKMQFYDDAHGTAQRMWKEYAAYHFGDFNPTANYKYDVVGNEFLGGLANYGYTVNRIPDGGAQFYLDHIDILQIHKGDRYDQYRLVNPRISMFDPDDFDYENNSVCLISMQVSYENLQYTIGQSTKDLAEFDEGATFDGDVPQLADSGVPYPTGAAPSDAVSITAPVASWLSSVQGPIGQVSDYRYENSEPGTVLESFGGFAFGSSGLLSEKALSSKKLSTVLDLGIQVSPLSINQWSIPSAAAAMSQRGFDGASYDVAQATVDSVTSYGPVQQQLVAGVVAADDIAVNSSKRSIDGIVLAPSAYGVINARQTGTAQYGFDPSGTNDLTMANFWEAEERFQQVLLSREHGTPSL